MRYTTIIDIRDFPELYRNQNLRLLYLHLVLKSGYHDDDRDQVHTSIRRLGYETGLTVSAVRHGLAMLKKFGHSHMTPICLSSWNSTLSNVQLKPSSLLYRQT